MRSLVGFSFWLFKGQNGKKTCLALVLQDAFKSSNIIQSLGCHDEQVSQSQENKSSIKRLRWWKPEIASDCIIMGNKWSWHNFHKEPVSKIGICLAPWKDLTEGYDSYFTNLDSQPWNKIGRFPKKKQICDENPTQICDITGKFTLVLCLFNWPNSHSPLQILLSDADSTSGIWSEIRSYPPKGWWFKKP